MFFALFFAGVLLLLAIVSIRRQLGNLRRLRTDSHVPSDDRSYLRKQAYRRILNGSLLLGLAGMLSGAYLSGMERHADELGQKKPANDDGEKPKPADDDRQFFRLYAIFWISVLVLLFVIVSLAIIDLWATRRYAWQQLRRMRTEHRAVLERDLAMYRQQQLNDRMRGAQ